MDRFLCNILYICICISKLNLEYMYFFFIVEEIYVELCYVECFFLRVLLFFV